ncbi:MAG: hypothetical protein VST70_09490 [Nitrospirota bacterium]|nr:hypothetical protein [Nitrospirota bacterium]
MKGQEKQSMIKTPNSEIEIFLLPEHSSEEFLIDLIEKYGSIELGIGLSSKSSSFRLMKTLRSVTNGFLVLNALYIEEMVLRAPSESERETLEKDCRVPLRWLTPTPSFLRGETVTGEPGPSISAEHLEPLLKSCGIRAFLLADGHALLMNRVGHHSDAISEVLAANAYLPSLAGV